VSRGAITVQAYAKVNLALRVLRRRDDGLHDLESLVTPVSLADDIDVEPHEHVRLEVTGPAPLVSGVPVDETNLAFRAAVALAHACPSAGGATIRVEKRIPVAAGLGGGSADAAAALRALNDLWGCGLDPQDLAEAAAHVGSDVPALLRGGPVVIRGAGSIVEPTPVRPLHLVLLPLGFSVTAEDAYRWWDEDGGVPGPSIEPMVGVAARGDLEAIAAGLANGLEGPVERRHAEIGRARERLLAAGAVGAMMSGSGPTVFGLCRDEAHAGGVASAVGPPAVAVTTLG
jgi:4-diphosphocytidyl-2-C-methyl-D-erythritol kinase